MDLDLLVKQLREERLDLGRAPILVVDPAPHEYEAVIKYLEQELGPAALVVDIPGSTNEELHQLNSMRDRLLREAFVVVLLCPLSTPRKRMVREMADLTAALDAGLYTRGWGVLDQV